MSDMTPRKLKGSLVERAAEAYDLNHFLRMPDVPVNAPLAPASPAAPAPAPVAAPAAEDLPFARPRPISAAVAAPLPVREGAAAIDRRLLAENGLLVPGAPVGPLAEEFRLVKRQLIATARTVEREAPGKARTMLVCSAQPNDGKTYCAINLAISLAAERDTEVLLVDADFAKPDVLARLGVRETGAARRAGRSGRRD